MEKTEFHKVIEDETFMKRIGIITILKVDNYGADLQAYALQRQMRKIGYDAEIIDYLYYKNHKFQRERQSYPAFKYPFRLWLREFGLVMRKRIESLLYKQAQKIRNSRFEDFHEKFTQMSKTFTSFSDLYKHEFDYDVYCVGSDQVWNPGNYTNLEPYFLTFAPDGKCLFSYASSFGVSKLPSYTINFYRKCLNRFKFISVREQEGKEIVEQLLPCKVSIVLDPTLLLNSKDWRNVAMPIPNIKGKFLIIYELRRNDYLRILARKIAKDLNLIIIRLCSSVAPVKHCKNEIQITTAGPAEFVWAFLNAQFVVTNSFHGTAFALNFGKNFYSITTHGRNNNSRQKTLLDLCGLSNRLLYEDSPTPDMNDYIVDFNKPHYLLENMRDESINFIHQAING